jgi:hypothetical protein
LFSIDHRGIDLGAHYWLVSGPLSAPTAWEAEVVRGRAALEEGEGLKTALADKAAALIVAEEQLRQE